jgi:hypothetical protein
MSIKHCAMAACAAGLLATLAGTAQADWVGAAAAMGATYHPGGPTVSGINGVCIGGNEGSGYQLTPTIPGYDYTTPSPMGVGAGDYADHHWVAEASGPFAAPAQGTMWVFGSSSQDFLVHTSIDHGPIPEEGAETTLWGSNDGGTTWLPSLVTDLFEGGWDPNSDEDITLQYRFSVPVSLISATAGLAQGNYYYGSDDAEIDAVTIVPTPGAAVLGAGALLVARRRRR